MGRGHKHVPGEKVPPGQFLKLMGKYILWFGKNHYRSGYCGCYSEYWVTPWQDLRFHRIELYAADCCYMFAPLVRSLRIVCPVIHASGRIARTCLSTMIRMRLIVSALCITQATRTACVICIYFALVIRTITDRSLISVHHWSVLHGSYGCWSRPTCVIFHTSSVWLVVWNDL